MAENEFGSGAGAGGRDRFDRDDRLSAEIGAQIDSYERHRLRVERAVMAAVIVALLAVVAWLMATGNWWVYWSWVGSDG